MEKTKISQKEALEAITSIREDISITEKRKKSEFISHLVVFIFVIAILWYTNLSTNSGDLWAMYPTLGWGMAIALHFLNYKKILPEESDSDENNFREDLMNYLIVIAFLWGINFWTSYGNWWATYPTISWGFFLVIRFFKLHFLKSQKDVS